jgi:two-component system CheB/CheR fusion protein
LSSSRFLASIVESSEDAIITKSLDGFIQTWNNAAQRLFGYAETEIIGRHISTIIPPDRLDEEQHIISQLRNGKRVEHFETIRLKQSGEPIHISLTVSPVIDEEGTIVGASKIARDISDRKQAEERIYGLMASLQESDRRKDEFLAMLAHELRGPLAPLRNMLELMKRADGNEELIEQARSTMQRQLNQLVHLVDDLIDVNRISRNKIELRKERVELASVVHQAVEACRPLADEAQHQLHVRLLREPIYLYADPVRLAQVFGNLLNNACKYTPPGGEISISAEIQGGDVAIRVKDNGMGIPPEKIESVFEMFSQVDRTLEWSQGGLGIGLTLVKRLVEMHDGTVVARSEGAGKGTEFEVRLPFLVNQPEIAAAPAPPPLQDSQDAIRSRNILVVDDNEDAAKSLSMLLKLLGHEVTMAHNGLDAVSAAADQRPEIILLDIGLPELNGYEACRRIRQNSQNEILIIALTGWGQEEDRRKSKEAGFDGHLVKPVDFNSLMNLIRQWEQARI